MKNSIAIETLKANKEQILDIIHLKGESAKRIMNLMVESIGARVYEGMNIEQFTKAVIEDNPMPLVITDRTAFYAEASKRQLSSSMR